MVPVTPAAVSIFGAPLGVASDTSILSPYVSSVAGAGNQIAPVIGSGVSASGSVLAGATPPAPFADLLVDAVGQVDKLASQAKSAVEGLISGQGVDVHEAMIATQKAGMGFELALAVRSKALSAYQQVMGMQF